MITLVGALTFATTIPAFAEDAELLTLEDVERHRLTTHFAEVLTELESADLSRWSDEQIAARRHAIHALQGYAERRQFPRNESDHQWTPVFVDAYGTHCAVGYLIAASGGADVVAEIQATQNLATVPEIEHPALTPWLDAHGLTEEEATRIQPWYCACGDRVAPVCGTGPGPSASVDSPDYEGTRAGTFTYLNECVANCADAEILSTGYCNGDDVAEVHPETYCPICGPGEDEACVTGGGGPPRGLAPLSFALFGLVVARRRNASAN